LTPLPEALNTLARRCAGSIKRRWTRERQIHNRPIIAGIAIGEKAAERMLAAAAERRSPRALS
jgi:hypothetical protein